MSNVAWAPKVNRRVHPKINLWNFSFQGKNWSKSKLKSPKFQFWVARKTPKIALRIPRTRVMEERMIPAIAKPRRDDCKPNTPVMMPPIASGIPQMGRHQPSRLTIPMTSEAIATP